MEAVEAFVGLIAVVWFPGSGNSDTVPAMLTPGEFVIKKSSVAKLGAENLAAMNQNRFSSGTQQMGVRKSSAPPAAGSLRGRQQGMQPVGDIDFHSTGQIGAYILADHKNTDIFIIPYHNSLIFQNRQGWLN